MALLEQHEKTAVKPPEGGIFLPNDLSASRYISFVRNAFINSLSEDRLVKADNLSVVRKYVEDVSLFLTSLYDLEADCFEIDDNQPFLIGDRGYFITSNKRGVRHLYGVPDDGTLIIFNNYENTASDYIRAPKLEDSHLLFTGMNETGVVMVESRLSDPVQVASIGSSALALTS